MHASRHFALQFNISDYWLSKSISFSFGSITSTKNTRNGTFLCPFVMNRWKTLLAYVNCVLAMPWDIRDIEFRIIPLPAIFFSSFGIHRNLNFMYNCTWNRQGKKNKICRFILFFFFLFFSFVCFKFVTQINYYLKH